MHFGSGLIGSTLRPGRRRLPEMVDRQRALAEAELRWTEDLLAKEGGSTDD